MKEFYHLTQAMFNILAISAGLLGGLWAYTKYVIERGLLPPIQFDIKCKPLGYIEESIILDIGIHLKNAGTATLVVRWVLLNVHYIKEHYAKKDDTTNEDIKEDIKEDAEKGFLKDALRRGRLSFPYSLIKDDLKTTHEDLVRKVIQELERSGRKPLPRPLRGSVEGIPVLAYDTFVQPNIDQRYSFVTKLPKDAKFAIVRASFEYAQKPRPLQDAIYRLSRTLGLIQYSLQHVDTPHTVERIISLRRAFLAKADSANVEA